MGPLRLPLYVLLAASALVACSSGPKPNVLLVTLDTTRADRIGCYGYPQAKTPALNALAVDGVRFDRAYSQAPLTLPSHASLLTGLYPASTGLRINATGRLADGVPTLADRLKSVGYRTGAFVSTFVLDATFGLDRGFERYDDDLVKENVSRHFELYRPGNITVDSALSWLAENPGQPFFAWVHLYDAHTPYAPPEPYRSELADPYDGEIAFADAQLARLIQWLEAQGLRERTLVIVAGDHGESFLEHGEPEHGLFVYDTTIRVPLVVSWPGKLEPSVSTANVQLVDVAPTVLELTNGDSDPRAHGVSLVPALRGENPPERLVYGESLYGELGYRWAPLRYVVRGSLKYVEAPVPELYDREVDHAETRNVIAGRASDASALRASLLEIEERIVPAAPGIAPVDPEVQEKLRSLGYVGGSTSSGTEGASVESDPKRMIDVYREHLRAIRLLRQQQFADAAGLLEELVRKSPGSSVLFEDLGMARLSLNRLEDALVAFEASAQREDPDRMWGHAETLRRLGRLDESAAMFDRAIARWPSLGEAYLGLGLVRAAQGDFARAYEPARKYAELTPASPLALTNLANVCLALRKYDEAVGTAERLLAVAPTSIDAHYVRWEALRAAGKRQEAIAALRDSRNKLPEDWLLTCSLAWMLAVSPDVSGQPGAVDEAVRLAQTCVQLNPRHPRSFDVLGAAHAARGSYADAAKAVRRAIALAQEQAPQAAAARQAMTARLALYDAGQPFRE